MLQNRKNNIIRKKKSCVLKIDYNIKNTFIVQKRCFICENGVSLQPISITNLSFGFGCWCSDTLAPFSFPVVEAQKGSKVDLCVTKYTISTP